MKIFYDAHCHLFNEKYVLRSILTENYKMLDVMLERYFDFIKSSVAASFKDLTSQYAKVGIKATNLRLFVLTYDLDFVFQETYGLTEQKNKFYFKPEDLKLDKLPFSQKIVDKINQLLEQSYSYKFENFIKETLDFYKTHKHNLLLFYYFDPRRPGAMEFVEKNVATKENPDRPFIGIKLYPPNGYSPLDPTMLKLFDYCEKQQIPIVVHFSYGGFSTFVSKLEVRGGIYQNGKIKEITGTELIEFKFKATKPESKTLMPEAIFRRNQIVRERAEILNHPVLWSAVLGEFPRLRINFAHYGMGSNLWTAYVLEFIRKYPNVYTDIACTDTKSLRWFKKLIDSEVGKKILYGSDYILNELNLISTKKYFKKVRRILGRKLLNIFAFDNPVRFIKKINKSGKGKLSALNLFFIFVNFI